MHPIWRFLKENGRILISAGQLVIEVGRAIKDSVSSHPKTRKPGSGPRKR